MIVPAATETDRFYALHISTPVEYLLERQMHCLCILIKLKETHDSLYGSLFFRLYETSRVCYRTSKEGFSSIVGLGFSTGFAVWVAINVMAIKCYYLIFVAVFFLLESLPSTEEKVCCC